ncbi:flagellin N-terminal helical domain-containing protein [Butyrivibrio sp. VCB2006]|uniref:flagellin N-terminal helical domain-containing protein n=1 Tax=Butyrivibrio sp. VCB2006 TaxID=1280679 RepID=UPI000400672E|nr:flagellin [Butyrivibrio sp. VCB2006]
MVIQHNIAAMTGSRELNIVTNNKAKSAEKLSSGYRINRAADDAAGLAISEKMRREIRGLSQGSRNIQEGISLCQVADGYLAEVHDMIQRINELAVKGANDTLTSSDRSFINDEVQAIKTEMSRIFDTATYNEIPIFHVPYMLEVEPDPEPYDIQLFYSSSGVIGGLEFNNIRYSIEELRNIPASQGQSMKLDANGIATEDQEVTFKLNYESGEEVKLKLKKGQSLAEVKREYNWNADDTGIYVNNVLAATWAELGISSTDNAARNVAFTHRGMKISFDVEEGHGINDIKNGINGDSFTSAATWDIGVSGATGRAIAPIVGNSTTRVAVTNSNKDDINDKYYISATSDGLAITKTEADGSNSTTTSRTAWNNISYSGNPIVDWGEDVDNNDSSQISFDNNSTYHYVSPDSGVPIQYYFKLADAASKPEVINILDGTAITGSIVCPTSTTSSNSALTISDKRIDGNNDDAFALQNSYGRNFDSSQSSGSTALGGNVTWKKIIVGDARQNEYDDPETGRVVTGSTDNTTDVERLYKVDQGDGTYKYYKVTETQHDQNWNYARYKTYHWEEKCKLEYSGQLGSAVMDSIEGNEISFNVSRTDTTSYTGNEKYNYYSNMLEITDLDSAGLVDGDFTEKTYSEFEVGRRYNTQAERYSAETTSTGSNVISNGSNSYTTSGEFVKDGDNSSDYAFKFTHRITYQELYNMISGSTGSSSITTKSSGAAYRNFTPNQPVGTLSEPDFLSITVNPPKKHCIIQCAPDVEDQHEINMEWSPLNLSIAGISGADCTTKARSLSTITLAKESLNIIAEERSTFGSYQNRLEHAARYTDNTVENTQASESRIRDTEMAHELSYYSNAQIIAQAGQMILAQANQTTQGVMNLLQ